MQSHARPLHHEPTGTNTMSNTEQPAQPAPGHRQPNTTSPSLTHAPQTPLEHTNRLVTTPNTTYYSPHYRPPHSPNRLHHTAQHHAAPGQTHHQSGSHVWSRLATAYGRAHTGQPGGRCTTTHAQRTVAPEPRPISRPRPQAGAIDLSRVTCVGSRRKRAPGCRCVAGQVSGC